MMLEEQLRKRLFFRSLGAFSINPGSRSAIESLNYAGEVLESNKNLLILFPQGKIHSLYTSEIDFQKGWFRIIKNAVNPVQIIFLANLTDYFSYRKPSLVTYLEEYTKTENFVLDEIAARYNDFYQKCLDHQKKMA